VSPQLDAFGIVVSDMARSLAFYRELGLEFPEGSENEGHVEAQLSGGMRYMLDTEDIAAGGKMHMEPMDAFWGQRYAQVQDPDGTVIDLYAALPEQQQS